MHTMTRRELLQLMASGAACCLVLNARGCGARKGTSGPTGPAVQSNSGDGPGSRSAVGPATPASGSPHLAVARGTDAGEITRRAVAAVGGMAHFVQPGQTVIVKPNICHVPAGVEYGTTTHPAVVGAVVGLALAAGARRVQVMDAPFAGNPKEAYARSGIADAVAAAGGEMVAMSPAGYADTSIPQGRNLKSWSMYIPALQADVIVDVPVAKHHSRAGLTLGMKNLMGLLEPRGRGRFHGSLHQNIADLTTLLRPALTVVDATRMLMAHGPTGGNLNDVRQENAVIASHDIVAADAYAATFFGRQPADIGYIAIAADMGLGRADVTSLQVEEVVL